jgi:hypothetical protein
MKTRVAFTAALLFASASFLSAVAPGAPQNLAASVSGNNVTLVWQPPSTGGVPTGYIIEAALSPSGAAIATLPTSDTILNVPAVPNGVYYVRARALNLDGTSGVSNEVIVVVPAAGGSCPAPPNAVTALTSSVTGSTVMLSWTPAPTGCAPTGYAVLAGSAAGLSDVAVINVPAGMTSLTAVAPPGTYFVRVVALNAFGGGAMSSELVVSVGGTGARVSIGFAALASVANRSSFTSLTESGFTVTATSASWEALTTFGNPIPFIQFTRQAGQADTIGEVTVAAGGAPFTFESVDVYSSITPIPHEIVGIRNGAPVFTITGTVPNTFGGFATVSNPQPATPIDTLQIRLTNPAACCSNPVGLDNIVVTR